MIFRYIFDEVTGFLVTYRAVILLMFINGFLLYVNVHDRFNYPSMKGDTITTILVIAAILTYIIFSIYYLNKRLSNIKEDDSVFFALELNARKRIIVVFCVLMVSTILTFLLYHDIPSTHSVMFFSFFGLGGVTYKSILTTNSIYFMLLIVEFILLRTSLREYQKKTNNKRIEDTIHFVKVARVFALLIMGVTIYLAFTK